MSVWDNLGNLYDGTKGWVGDVGSAVMSPFKFAWDVFNAPMSDVGVMNAIKNSASKRAADLGRPLGGIFAAALHASEGTRQAVGAVEMYSATGDWSQSWEHRDEVSVGQATALALSSPLKLLPDSVRPEFLKNNFNVYDKKQRDAAFHNSIYGKVVSGTLDLGAEFFLDPTLVLGKVVKVYKAADKAEKAIVEINNALRGATNKYSKLGEDFAANDGHWAADHQWVRDGNNQSTSSYLLGQTKTKEEALHTMKALMGDNSGAEALINLNRPDLARPLSIANGNLTHEDLNILLRQEREMGATQIEDMLMPYYRTEKQIAEDQKYVDAWVTHDKYAAALTEIVKQAPMVEGIGKNQALSRELATARSLPFHSQKLGFAREDVYQPTVYHTMYSKISWLAGERPSGIVNLNEGDSIREIQATVKRLLKLTPETFTVDVAGGFVDAYAAATTSEARAAVVNRLEQTGYQLVAAKHGIDREAAQKIFDSHISLRTRKLLEAKSTGFIYDQLSNKMLKVPLFESQNANFLPVADFDMVNKVLGANKSDIKQMVLNSEHLLNSVNDLWKASVLLRLGYPLRNAIDSQLRIWNTVGALATLGHVKQGTENVIKNIADSRMGSRLIDRFSNIEKTNPTELASQVKNLSNQITAHNAEIERLTNALKKSPGDTELAGQLALEANKARVTNAAYELNNKSLSEYETAKGVIGKRTMGQGQFTLKSKFSDVTGDTNISVNDGFGNVQAEMYRSMNSSDANMQSLLTDHARAFNTSLKSSGVGAITPDNPTYFAAWAHTLNTAFVNSAVTRQFLAGKNFEEVVKWLKENKELRDKLHNLSKDEVKAHVAQVENIVNQYIPKGSTLRQKLLQNGPDAVITPGYLRNEFRDARDLPIVHGSIVDENLTRNGEGITQNILSKAFKFLGSRPEDAWARHPLFIDLYRKSIQKRVDTYGFLNNGKITREEFAKVQYDLETAARADALKGVKEILYNVERRSNAAHMLKLISPFFSAQENSIKTYLRIASDNPSIISRAGTLWTTPNRLGIATDSNGNLVPPGQAISPDDTIWLPIPKQLKKIPFVGRGLSSLDQIGFSKRSMDVIFQGSPLGLSVGPMAGIAAGKIAKHSPTFGEMTAFLFPYGQDDSLKQILPTWARRAWIAHIGLEDPEYAKAYQLIWLTEQHKARDNNTPYLTDADIKSKTDAFFNIRAGAAVILPFAPAFKSPYRHYIDKWHEYSTKYGLEADTKFLQDFPEFFDFATSMNKNDTNIAATMGAVSNAKRYSGLISRLQSDNPALTALVTNGTDKVFNQTAAWWEEQTTVGPGTSTKFHGTVNPAEAVAKNEARKGWASYRIMTAQIDAELYKRGLSSVNSQGAEDLKAVKSMIVNKLSTKIDPVTGLSTGEPSAWAIDYADVDGLKAAKNIDGLKKIVNNVEFMKANGSSPTWKSVFSYLQLRDSIAKQLFTRSSTSIDAQSNSDLRASLEYYTSQLRRGDIGFADIYDKFLSQDKIFYKTQGLGA